MAAAKELNVDWVVMLSVEKQARSCFKHLVNIFQYFKEFYPGLSKVQKLKIEYNMTLPNI